jgi:quercetin dioxygenase-like cupin family protein
VREEADETSGYMPTELGERIKQLRLAQNLTLKQVGEKAKVSATHLSEIERGKTSPTVGALVRIARALGQEPARMVSDEQAPVVAFTRRAERRVWTSGLLTLSSLSPGIAPHEISMLEIALPAGQTTPAAVPGDAGEALAVVLEGGVEIELGGKRHLLREGEALHFRLHDTHALRTGSAAARLLWVTYPPLSI